MHRIAAVMVLTLTALGGPGLMGAKSAVVADAMPSGLRPTGASGSPAVTGTRLWVRRFVGPGSGDDLATSVAVSPSGGTVFVTGYTFAGTQDYTTFAYDAATGIKLWVRRYNGPGKGDDQASSLAVSPDGGAVFVTGYTTGAAGTDYATVAYDAATGARLWARRYNGPGNGDDHASSVAVSPSGGTVYVTGTSIGTTATNYDYATVAYNAATGTTQWVKRYDGSGNAGDAASSLALGPGGGTLYVTGYSYVGATRGYDYATVAYNAATGARAWVSRYNGPADSTDAAYSVAVSPVTGAAFVTGISYGRNGNGDYLTVAYTG